MRVCGTGADGEPIGLLRPVRRGQQGGLRVPAVDPHGGGPRPYPSQSDIPPLEVLREGREAQGEAQGHRRHGEEALAHHLLDAPEQGAVSRSRIQPREPNLHEKCVKGIGADP